MTSPGYQSQNLNPDRSQMQWIEGGEFTMGSNRFYPEERPTRKVAVDGFWIATEPVTNEEFARFVSATGYITVAERPLDPKDYPGAALENLQPGSMVFTPPPKPVSHRDIANWWSWVLDASWQNPLGNGSTITDILDHPVVHVSYEDAIAYCQWAQCDLPTEAEWEYAARGGLEQASFTWGDDDPQDTEPLANTWQGSFPWENQAIDGWFRTSPVKSFPPNGYGLFDMAGNVWEWTNDWYSLRSDADESVSPCCVPRNPRGGFEEKSFDPRQPHLRIPRKVVKGGSHLCAPNYCLRYRPAARQPQMIDTGMSHLGFRCIIRNSGCNPPTA